MQKSAESHRGLQLAERVMFVCKKFLCLLLALLIVLAGCSTISDDTPAATNTQDPTISEPVIKNEVIVYITKTGEKYHTAGCSYLKKSKIPIELSDAKNNGYTPCSRCNPSR